MKTRIATEDTIIEVEQPIYRKWWQFWKPKVVGSEIVEEVYHRKGDSYIDAEGATQAELYDEIMKELRREEGDVIDDESKRKIREGGWVEDPNNPDDYTPSNTFICGCGRANEITNNYACCSICGDIFAQQLGVITEELNSVEPQYRKYNGGIALNKENFEFHFKGYILDSIDFKSGVIKIRKSKKK